MEGQRNGTCREGQLTALAPGTWRKAPQATQQLQHAFSFDTVQSVLRGYVIRAAFYKASGAKVTVMP